MNKDRVKKNPSLSLVPVAVMNRTTGRGGDAAFIERVLYSSKSAITLLVSQSPTEIGHKEGRDDSVPLFCIDWAYLQRSGNRLDVQKSKG